MNKIYYYNNNFFFFFLNYPFFIVIVKNSLKLEKFLKVMPLKIFGIAPE
jgi:hypothetical protein